MVEKTTIAKLAAAQVAALVYTMLCSGLMAKMMRQGIELHSPNAMPWAYYLASFVRDYGIFFSVFIVAWVVIVGYYESSLAPVEGPSWLVKAAIVFCVVAFLGSTVFALLAILGGLGLL